VCLVVVPDSKDVPGLFGSPLLSKYHNFPVIGSFIRLSKLAVLPILSRAVLGPGQFRHESSRVGRNPNRLRLSDRHSPARRCDTCRLQLGVAAAHQTMEVSNVCAAFLRKPLTGVRVPGRHSR
jgi:hypothetical protein